MGKLDILLTTRAYLRYVAASIIIPRIVIHTWRKDSKLDFTQDIPNKENPGPSEMAMQMTQRTAANISGSQNNPHVSNFRPNTEFVVP